MFRDYYITKKTLQGFVQYLKNYRQMCNSLLVSPDAKFSNEYLTKISQELSEAIGAVESTIRE